MFIIDEKSVSSIVQLYCSPCLSDDKGYSGINPNNFDHKVSPKDNFYLWSNGAWKENNPIPSDYSSWNTFVALRDLNLERLMELLNELSSNEDKSTNINDAVDGNNDGYDISSAAALNANTIKLADYYNTFMNEELIESKGIISPSCNAKLLLEKFASFYISYRYYSAK